MNIADLTTYFLTIIAIAIAPGPVVLMLIVRAAGNDTRGALGFGFGYAIGGLIIISAVCFGLSAWLTAVPEIFEYSKYVLMAYILFMARGIWKGGFDLNQECADPKKRSMFASTFAGIMTCTISPYMMILFPLILPGMMDIQTIKMPDFLIIAVTTFLALATGAGLIIGFAAQLRRLVRSPKYLKTVNRSLAAVLVVGGGFMALS